MIKNTWWTKQQNERLLAEMAHQLYTYLEESPYAFIPVSVVKRETGLDFPCGKSATGESQTGWVFGAVARYLEDKDLIHYDGRSIGVKHAELTDEVKAHLEAYPIK